MCVALLPRPLAAGGYDTHPAMRTLKLTIAYDGTAYAGWQLQLGEPTIQETLEDAIARVTGQRVRVLASGRTDAGVHALGQVVGFRTDSSLPPEVLLRAINANLPHDVAVLDAAEAPDDFHPIRHALRKRYRYVIHDGPVRDVFGRRFVWHYNYGRLDAPSMQRAAAALLGTHDFRSFQSSGAERRTSVRTILELSVERGRAGHTLPSPFGRGAGGEGGATEGRMSGEGRAGGRDSVPHAEPDDFIFIEIEANGFLYNMVRAIVGTLVQVGCGARPENWPGEVLCATDRCVAGPTAPPQGLCLIRVEY
jgi:tRNA pseudouridine38-40 synthase